MLHTWNKLALLSALGAVVSLAVWFGTATATEETSVLVKKPAQAADSGPVLPPPSNPNELRAPDELPAPNSASSADPFAPPTNGSTNNGAVKSSAKQPLPVPPQTQSAQPAAKQSFMRPARPLDPAKGKLVAEPTPAVLGATNNAQVQPLPAPPSVEEGIEVRPTPPIEYDTDKDARRMYRSGKIELVMVTKDPTSGCAYEIPICIPACCVGDPLVSAKTGIFGRGVVEYRWACGFRAIVKFRHVLGDVKVEYEGD
jgi:hypothetical protein